MPESGIEKFVILGSHFGTRLIQIQIISCIGCQRCGLGLDVSVSGWSRDVLTFRLGQNPERLGLGELRLVSGIGPLHLVETFCTGACRA